MCSRCLYPNSMSTAPLERYNYATNKLISGTEFPHNEFGNMTVFRHQSHYLIRLSVSRPCVVFVSNICTTWVTVGP
jgi:hypothetical protein